MRRQSVAVLAAAFLAGGSTVALAQSGSGGSQMGQEMQGQSFGSNAPGIKRDWVPGPLSPAAERQGEPVQYNRTWPAGDLSAAGETMAGQGRLNAQTRYNERVRLRRELRQLGFQNIHILDAMYLVQARAPDGQRALMVLSPADGSSAATTSALGTDRSAPGQDSSARGQQFGASRNDSPTVDLSELSDRMADAGVMDPGQLRSHLQSRGFTNISNLNRDGNVYTGTASWFGEQVELRVDGRNGFVIEPSNMTQGQLRNMLSQYGWDFTGQIERQGTSYRVEAARNGRPFTLWIDARTGEINRQVASN